MGDGGGGGVCGGGGGLTLPTSEGVSSADLRK